MACHGLECCLLFMAPKDSPEFTIFPNSLKKNIDQERGAAQATVAFAQATAACGRPRIPENARLSENLWWEND